MELCLLFSPPPPLIIQITPQCNRYTVQDVLTLLQEWEEQERSSERDKTGRCSRYPGRNFFAASHLKLSRHVELLSDVITGKKKKKKKKKKVLSSLLRIWIKQAHKIEFSLGWH